MTIQTKPLIIAVLSLFIVLLLGAIFFAQERVMFCDASLIFTEVINSGDLRIQENRYGSFITQIFPLFFSKIHMPLQAIIVLYSASFNLFYLFVVAVLLFRVRNYQLAVLMSFYYILFASDTYFWTNNEIHQAIAWLFLLAGTIIHYKPAKSFWIHAILFSILTFFSLFTHPLIIIILPFLWLFILVDKKINPYSRKEALILTGIIIIVCFIKYRMMNHGGYDTNKIEGARNAFKDVKDVIAIFTSPMARLILKKLIFNYYFIPLLFITGLYFAYREKRYIQIALVVVFTGGYFMAICLMFTEFITFYTESEWMPFTIITTILFVYYALPKLKPNVALTLIIVIFAVRLTYIARAAPKFIERKNWVFGMVDKMERQGIYKGYVYRNDETEGILIMSWGLPTESMIASSLRGDKPNRTFFTDNREGIVKRSVASSMMIASFGPWDHQFFNPVYFNIDTTAKYQLINTDKP